MTFDIIREAVIEAAVGALAQGTTQVARRAQALAPVRNIFGEEYDFRPKTPRERERDEPFIGTKVPAEMGAAAYTATGKRPPRQWRDRRTTAANRLLGEYEQEISERRLGKEPEPTRLTRRGANEVRSKRADFSTWGHTHVGGRLRGEIEAILPTSSGDMVEAWVISPTPYAKYQEFGTRHNRAHPFLRPAAEESRGPVVKSISRAVKTASKKGVKTVIEAEVRL